MSGLRAGQAKFSYLLIMDALLRFREKFSSNINMGRKKDMIRLFEVGGHVRDSIMGLQSKDIDIAVEASSWEEMRDYVVSHTKKIFLEKPEFLTIRALDHDGGSKDFVLCRKESSYSDGRRPDKVEVGTIEDDLSRRDFTLNSIGRNVQTGEIIDLFGGIADIRTRTLRCVGLLEDRFNEDSLRILRAIRFCITKGFSPDENISGALRDSSWAPKLSSISRERIREELFKCFSHDPISTMNFLIKNVDPALVSEIFGSDIWLKPTMEKR